MKKPCHECKEPLEPNEQNTIKEYPGKVFCEDCVEEILDSYRWADDFTGIEMAEFFGSDR